MELTFDQALKKGIEAHRAGELKEADRYYTAVLKAQPNHPDANHNIGVLSVGAGKVQEALPFFRTALKTNPKIAQFWLSYITTLIKLERKNDAKAAIRHARKNGFKGDSFNKLEQRLNEPTQYQLQQIINLYTQGQPNHALSKASKLLLKFPSSVTLHNICGVANQGEGRLDEALIAYRKALSINPDYAEAYGNMGVVFKEQGKLEEAIEAYSKALKINPDYTQAYNNIGNALREQGKLEEAIEAYNKALKINPDYAEVYNNTANALRDQGKLDEAIEACNKALSINPDFAEAYNNIGNALQDKGKLDEAIEAYNKALSINPEFADALYNMGNALKGVIFTKPNKILQLTINSILDKQKYVRPKEIAKAAISLLKFESSLQKHLKLVDGNVLQRPTDFISDLSEFPLLLKLMSVCPLPDLELEKLLKKLRASLLLNISEFKSSPESLKLQSALALQCFTNEYIYNQTNEESDALIALERVVRKTFKEKEQPRPEAILALASYKALYNYDWCNLLVIRDEIAEVFKRQVLEPQKEKSLKSNIAVMTAITDNISSKVREQYEESPYPKWINVGLPLKPASFSQAIDAINLKLFNKQIMSIEAPNILIAGCGTGQHPIGTSVRFHSSKVLAIDLSLTSLAYAKRKTEELAIKNIEYMQADILDLGTLKKQFDIVESGGVLHHMNDPMAGWKVLTQCLRPGGLMKIGLYSEIARHHIIKIRKEISELDIGTTNSEMRSFRDTIIKSQKDHHRQILSSLDFYNLSSLRDLIFHVQEHRFTIPEIKGHLDGLGLKFCGFEANKIVSHFKQNNTGKDDPYDLDKWQAYEKIYPRTFAGMYQFWCQKVD